MCFLILMPENEIFNKVIYCADHKRRKEIKNTLKIKKFMYQFFDYSTLIWIFGEMRRNFFVGKFEKMSTIFVRSMFFVFIYFVKLGRKKKKKLSGKEKAECYDIFYFFLVIILRWLAFRVIKLSDPSLDTTKNIFKYKYFYLPNCYGICVVIHSKIFQNLTVFIHWENF